LECGDELSVTALPDAFGWLSVAGPGCRGEMRNPSGKAAAENWPPHSRGSVLDCRDELSVTALADE
jgi:hypothetical protein